MYSRVILVFAAVAFALAAFALVMPAHGKDITTYQCIPASAMTNGDKDYVSASEEQLRFLQAVYVMQKWAPDDLPPGDAAIMKRVGDNMKVIFLDGDQACASMILYKAGSDAIEQIARGEINHVGKPT